MTDHREDVQKKDVNIMTYNANLNKDFYPIIKLLKSQKADILAIQEPHKDLLCPSSSLAMEFERALPSNGYKIHRSVTNLTIISPRMLSHYAAQPTSSTNGRVLITPIEITTDYTIYILNIYGCQRSHPDYISINSNIMSYLDDFRKDLATSNYHVIALGDINLDLHRDHTHPANLLHYLTDTFHVFSTYQNVYYQQEDIDFTNNSLPPTYEDANGGKSHIDHIFLPLRMIPSKKEKDYHPRILHKLKYNTSPHHPLLLTVALPLQHIDDLSNDDIKPPLFSVLSSIPLKPGQDPTNPEENTDWFTPDDALLPPDTLEIKQKLIKEAHELQTKSPRLRQLLQNTNAAISNITTIIKDHAQNSSDLIPRTTILQDLLSDAFDNIDKGIETTMGLLDLFADPPDVKAYSKPSIQERLSLSKECILSSATCIKNAAKAKRDRKLPVLLKTLNKQLHRLETHIENAEAAISKNIKDTETMITIRQQRDMKDPDQDHATEDSQQAAPPNTAMKDHPPIISMNPKDVKLDKAFDLIKKHQKFLKTITTTKDITTAAIDTLSDFRDDSDNVDSQLTLPFITDLHQQYIVKIKGRIKYITTNYTNLTKDFHSQFGDPAQPAQLIKPKLHAPPAANTTIPIYTDATSAPTHVPAVGPHQQKQATIATQQQQADKPPGKQLHFVELTRDQVGPNGIIYDPTKSFTAKDLPKYHPAANQFPQGVQEEIIQAHEIFPSITESLRTRYLDNQHKPEVQWPFQASITTCPETQAPLLTLRNEQPSMQKKIHYVPSAARLNGFTLNVLARLHPCWMRALDKLTNLILITRILPRRLKTTGRVLIDKPNSTDKRPISILHAYDSYIDNIVAQHLAQAVEDLNIYDDTIAAYRPGHSCADCTLNHLLAIQDTKARKGYYLCQLDEDKEKYFDRITTELQLLPFHLMGFPNHGYMEWIAESLHNVTVLTATPFGTVKTDFHCGVRQGSALSCVIANAVAWLSAAPWAMSLMNSPSPPGHQPAQLHPFDITHGHNAMLQKASYCDDSSAYITSTNPQTLFEYISRDIAYSNIISIVTKLSINAKKSRIRIYNLPSRYPIPSFHYVSWHHLTKTVQAERIPTDNMEDLSPTSTNKHFGTHTDKVGHTQSNQRKHFPKMHASRKSFKDLQLHPATFSKEYSSLVTSTLNFNVLAMTYDLAAAIKDDHITLYSLAAPTYGLRPAADALSSIFLPPSALGHNFNGALTLQLATATARELFVTLNAPHPQQTSLLQSRARATLHRLTTTAPTFDPLDTIPHALDQLALLGIYLLPTSYPIANQALTQLIHYDDSCTALGTPQIQDIANTSPLKHLLNYHNTKYVITDKIYRSLLLTLFSLYNTMDTPFHKSSTFQEIQYTTTMPTPVHNPYHTPQERASLLRSAASDLRPQYNHLSHFLQLDFLQNRTLAQPKNFLNNDDLSPTLFKPHSLFPLNTYDPWPASPVQSLRDFQTSHTLRLTADCPTFSHSSYVQQTLGSPLLYSSDSGYSNKTGYTVASSILLSFTTTTVDGVQTIQLDKPVLPILLRNHILAKTYGTKETDNNMGEAQGLILSLRMAPTTVPSIFLLDSRIVLLQVMAYFHPSDTTIRQKLRQQIHTTSMYHYSELQAALLHHWPDASFRPSEIPMQNTTYTVRANYLLLLEQLQETLGETSIVHLKPNTKCPKFTDDTKGICIGHHLFFHVNSHQLTNTGRLKRDQDTNQVIPPTPNFAMAHGNTFADRGATRMTTALPRDMPNFILEHLPQPPITALQYVYYHDSRVVNSDSSTYFKEQFVQHNYIQVLRRPDHWYLHFAPHFTDPTGKFASNTILKSIAQERATSHQRLIRINKSYRQHFQNKRHPFRNDMPTQLITTEMLRCPLCNTSSTSATTLHYHLQCPAPTIQKERLKHAYKITAILEDLDLVTQYMIASIYPITCDTTAPVWQFSTFLRTAIDRTALITPLDKDQRTEYISTGIYPPFRDLSPSNSPDWQDHHLLPSHKRPTLAHDTYLLGPSDSDMPEYPTTHIHVISLLGLLPINTHLAVNEYFHMLLKKFESAAHVNDNSRDLHNKRHLHLPYIIEKIEKEALNVHEDSKKAYHKLNLLLKTYKDTDDLGTLLRDRFTILLQCLAQKSVRLQQTINRSLQREQNSQPAHHDDQPSSKKSKKRKSTKKADTNNKRLKRTPLSRHYACHGPWCALKKATSLPYTITDCKRICSQCDKMNHATTLATNIIAHLVCQESALALLLHYTSTDPTQYDSMLIARRLSTLRIPIDEIREILSNVISHTDTQHINPAITFLEKNDAQFVPPDKDLLQKILQLIAHACLITTDPHPTREFPPLTPIHIHSALDQATDLCKCSHPEAAPHLHTHLCIYCSRLIPNKYRTQETSTKDVTTCITCDKVLMYTKHCNSPCDICTMTAIIIQRNPKATWISLIKTTTPSVLKHAKATPYEYISHAISKCASRSTPSMTPADIYLPPVSASEPYLDRSELHLDYVYQECYDDEPICENLLFRPCPPPTPFPQTFATPARPNAITITNLHLALHPALYNHNEQLHLHYKRPAFPRFDGIRPPAFGYYPEMFFDENVQILARAMPNLHIYKVSPTIIHPHKSYINEDSDFPCTTVTWSHMEHPNLEPRDPNETIYPTPETFYLTFYPPLHNHSPFHIRLCFQVKDTADHASKTHNIPSSDIVIYLKRREHPTLFALTLLYLVVTLPPTFLNHETVSNYMLTFPDNLRYLHRESTYLHAILHDERYCDALHLITAPWKITYTPTDPDYTDHPNDRPNKHNPDNPNTKTNIKKR